MGAKIRLNGLQGKIEDINESTSELEKIQAVISKVSDNLRGIKGINDSLDDLSDRLATHSIKLDYSPVEYSHNLEELSEAEEKVTSEIKDLEEVFQNILFPQAQPTSKIVNCILD